MATGIVLMYSGIENPKRELTKEETDAVEAKCGQLYAFNPTELVHPQMGFSGYGVELDDKYVIADKRGFVSVYLPDNNTVCWYDEVGLFAYLDGVLGKLKDSHQI